MPPTGQFNVGDMVLAKIFNQNADELKNTLVLCTITDTDPCGNGTWSYCVRAVADWFPLKTTSFWLRQSQLEATKWALNEEVYVPWKGHKVTAKVTGIKQVRMKIKYDVELVGRMMLNESDIEAIPSVDNVMLEEEDSLDEHDYY